MSYMHINNLYKDQRVLQFKEVFCLEKIHGCLHEDSMINMADGTKKEIKKINSGDLIISFDEKTKQFINKEVKAIVVQESTNFLDWYELILENGKRIICTEDHPVLTTKGWIQAKNISEKDDIISINVI